MFKKKDVDLFMENIEMIKGKLLKNENTILVPTFNTRKNMEKIMFDFLAEHKRKIYGGYSINQHIMAKNPKDAFYNLDSEVADIDFYSPEPVLDCIKIAKLFKDKGYGDIEAKEAQHEETYSVFVEYTKVCDISYCPKHIYSRIPFIEINKIIYCDPAFIMIDMFRMLTDPLISGSFRWEKTVPRIYLLQKYYPFNVSIAPLQEYSYKKTFDNFQLKNQDQHQENDKVKEYKLTSTDEKQISNLLNIVSEHLLNNFNFILYGDTAYNYYYEQSHIKDKKFKKLKIFKYDLVAFEYIDDVLKLYDLLKHTLNESDKQNLTIKEYYPFWLFTGYSCAICYKDYPVANITAYNNRCVPIKKAIIDNKFLQIAAYDYNFLLTMIDNFRARVEKNNDLIGYKRGQLSHLLEFKKFYFDNTNKKQNMLDDTPFQQFIVDCVGHADTPKREGLLKFKKKKKENRRILWKYNPQTDKDPEGSFQFKNSSGNLVRNEKNLKIVRSQQSDSA